MKRYVSLLRRSRINPISTQRRKERAEYNRRRLAFLALHPFDQIYIARYRLDEQEVIAGNGRIGGFRVPRATQIHHRNKATNARLNDERWWMATSLGSHNDVENAKGWARTEGYLLPIQADPEGRWGDGNQAETTAELLARRAKK